MALRRNKEQEETPVTVEEIAGVSATAAGSQQVEVRRAIDEIVPEIMSSRDFDADSLRDAVTFEDFYRMTEQAFGEVVDATQVLGDGFMVLTRKQKETLLIDVPCLLMSWSFRAGDFARPFASVRVVARHDNGSVGKYIVNDGSVGIADQLAAYTQKTGKSGGVFARGGFSRSDYDTTDAQGNTIPASTVYINTSTLA